MSERPNTNSASERTRAQIILAAEKLFGEQGIDAVSLRQINVAANQKNSSATHYHFGSKEALVKEIFDYRMEPVNQRRHEMLDALNNDRTVRRLIEAMVYPILEVIDTQEGGRHYIRFLSQMTGHPAVDLGEIWSSEYGTALNTLARELETSLPYVPSKVFYQRFGFAMSQIINSLADRARMQDDMKRLNEHEASLHVSNLIDCVAGALSAPVSETTLKELDDVKRDAS